MRINWLLFCSLMMFFSWAHAGVALPVAEDAELEKRVMAVSGELRCLVCQNQTIADSHAELATDLRNQVREMLKQGKSEQDIVDFMVKRYGDFVLYRPQMKSSTAWLWFGPFVLLLLAFVVLAFKLRQRRRMMQQAELNSDEHARAAQLLAGTDKGDKS